MRSEKGPPARGVVRRRFQTPCAVVVVSTISDCQEALIRMVRPGSAFPQTGTLACCCKTIPSEKCAGIQRVLGFFNLNKNNALLYKIRSMVCLMKRESEEGDKNAPKIRNGGGHRSKKTIAGQEKEMILIAVTQFG